MPGWEVQAEDTFLLLWPMDAVFTVGIWFSFFFFSFFFFFLK